MRALSLSLVLLSACEVDPSAVSTTLEQNPFGSAEACPPFATGSVSLEAGDLLRDLEVELPADPHGAPVVFAWHWLNGTATQTLDWMGMRALANEGAIVIAPETSGLPFEWDLEDPSDANPDLALFDTVLACLWEEHRVDVDRIYATGMSAGGLMTTLLTLHRAEVLAATAPFSGGAFAEDYTPPARDLPVLVTWGGPSDTFGGFDFHAASQSLADHLEGDGHFVVRCMHDLGHQPPQGAAGLAWRLFEDHPAGVDSPWAGGLPAGFPDWCE